MTYFWFALTGLKVRRPDKAFNSMFIFSFFLFFFFFVHNLPVFKRTVAECYVRLKLYGFA